MCCVARRYEEFNKAMHLISQSVHHTDGFEVFRHKNRQFLSVSVRSFATVPHLT